MIWLIPNFEHIQVIAKSLTSKLSLDSASVVPRGTVKGEINTRDKLSIREGSKRREEGRMEVIVMPVDVAIVDGVVSKF